MQNSRNDSDQILHYRFKGGQVDYVPFYGKGFGALEVVLSNPIKYKFNNKDKDKEYSFPTPIHLYWAIRIKDEPNFEDHLKTILNFSVPDVTGALSDYAIKLLGDKWDDVESTYHALTNTIYERAISDDVFKTQLMNTGDAYLVYDSESELQGNGKNGLGKNLRGAAMMQVREFIKTGETFKFREFQKTFEKVRDNARTEMKNLETQLGKDNTQGQSIPALARMSRESKEEIKPRSSDLQSQPHAETFKFNGGEVEYLPVYFKSGLGALGLSGEKIAIEREKHTYSFKTPSHYYAALRLWDSKDYVTHFRQIESLETQKEVKGYLDKILGDKSGQDLNWSTEEQYRCLVDVYLARAATDKNFKDQLMNSGNSYIVFDQKNPLLGVGIDGKGQNLRGKALMEVRARLKFGNDKFNQKEFDKYFENLRNKAREERHSLDRDKLGIFTDKRISIKKLHQLSQKHPIKLDKKKEAPVPTSTGVKPKSDLSPTTPKVEVPVLTENKKKDGPSKRLIQDKSEAEVPAEKISSSGTRIDLQRPEILHEIKESFIQYRNPKNIDQGLSIQHWKIGDVVIYHIVVTVETEKTEHTIKVHKNMLSTTNADEETFKMMIQALERVHGKDFKPKVVTQDDGTRRRWLNAFKELGDSKPEFNPIDVSSSQDKKKDGPPKRLIQDESDLEVVDVKEEKISSSGPRINLLHAENLNKIKESLEEDKSIKSIEHEKTDNGDIFRIVSSRVVREIPVTVGEGIKDIYPETIPMTEEKHHSIKVHKNMLSTTDGDDQTFKMMIRALEKVHGKDFKPKVVTQDADTQARWITAFSELGYSNPEKFVHTNPNVHKEVHEERETPTRRPG